MIATTAREKIFWYRTGTIRAWLIIIIHLLKICNIRISLHNYYKFRIHSLCRLVYTCNQYHNCVTLNDWDDLVLIIFGTMIIFFIIFIIVNDYIMGHNIFWPVFCEAIVCCLMIKTDVTKLDLEMKNVETSETFVIPGPLPHPSRLKLACPIGI